MGNCLASNKVSSHILERKDLLHSRDWKDAKAETVESKSSTSLNDQPGSAKALPKTKKVFRFGLHEDERSEKGVTPKDGHHGRIRVVVTRQEVQQILDLKDKGQQSSLKQLLDAVKLREIGGVPEGGDFAKAITQWKPVLESIQEDS